MLDVYRLRTGVAKSAATPCLVPKERAVDLGEPYLAVYVRVDVFSVDPRALLPLVQQRPSNHEPDRRVGLDTRLPRIDGARCTEDHAQSRAAVVVAVGPPAVQLDHPRL
jgi:hypothetical protein